MDALVQMPLPSLTNNQSSTEDMDLIEILLRQDIDLGVTREVFDAQLRREVEKTPEQILKEDSSATPDDVVTSTNPWAGLNYTIDSETGEHVIQDEDEDPDIPGVIDSPIEAPLTEDELLSLSVDFENIPLDEALQLTEFDKDETQEELLAEKSPESGLGEEPFLYSPTVLGSSPLSVVDLGEESLTGHLGELEEMIQATQIHMHPPNARPFQARMPYIRTVSMEQRWQDLANILSLPLSTESDIHNPLAMVHAPNHHNYTTATNTSFGGIDNRSAILLHNATLAPPMGDINSNISYHSDMAEICPVAAAVATSLTTLTNGSEPMGDETGHGGAYGGGDGGGGLLFPHNHTEINQTTDGFLSSILNDEDLQLMDMTMNDGPYNSTDRYVQGNQTIPVMYPMRMENDDAMDTSSDSAVSSMGSSERVVSISDATHGYCRNTSEWTENATDSSHHDNQQDRYYGGMDYTHHAASMPNKYRPYEYASYPSRHHHVSPTGNGHGNPPMDRPMPQVAQKKYQLFGKRFLPDQAMSASMYGRNSAMVHQPDGIKYSDYPYDRTQHDRSGRPPFEMAEGATAIDPPEHKFSCSMEFARQHNSNSVHMEHVQHNHTYQLPSESLMSPQRPTVRDKQKKKLQQQLALEEDHASRDEKRARALKIPLTTDEIINLPMDEFNERISKFDLTEAQLALIRDIRRRGKNKVAAQNCRKRKLDQIMGLAEVVQTLQQSKEDVFRQHDNLLAQRQRLQDKYAQLYRHVFQSLRDADGNSYPPHDYSLQQAANGSIILVPNSNRLTNGNGSNSLDLDPTSGAKAKKKDDENKK